MAAVEPEESISYRSVSLRDLDALQALHLELNASESNPFTALSENTSQVAFELKRLRQALLASERYVCVVAHAGEAGLVGYCAATLEQTPSVFRLSMYGTISELYVSPAFRRRGVARELVQRVLGTLAARGVTMVEATVSTAQSEGQSFFSSLGFRPQVVHMALDLEASAAQSSQDGSESGDAGG